MIKGFVRIRSIAFCKDCTTYIGHKEELVMSQNSVHHNFVVVRNPLAPSGGLLKEKGQAMKWLCRFLTNHPSLRKTGKAEV